MNCASVELVTVMSHLGHEQVRSSKNVHEVDTHARVGERLLRTSGCDVAKVPWFRWVRVLEFCRDVRKQVICTWAGILNAGQAFSATVLTVWHASDGEAVEFSAREVLHERVLKFTKFCPCGHAAVGP